MRSEREVYEELRERGRQVWEEELPVRDERAVQFYFDMDEYGFSEAVQIAKDDSVRDYYEALGTPISYRYEYRLHADLRRGNRLGDYESYEAYVKDQRRAIEGALAEDEWEHEFVVKTGRLYETN